MLLLFLLSVSIQAERFLPYLDINDPELAKETVMTQCQKSLLYAPEQLEVWCEKAYKLGYWQALEYIGLHTGDGTRYIAELNKRAEMGKHNAVFYLAWNYHYGRFVSKNIEKSISLYHQYINNITKDEKPLLNRAHKELIIIYKELGELEKSAAHQQILDQYADIKTKQL